MTNPDDITRTGRLTIPCLDHRSPNITESTLTWDASLTTGDDGVQRFSFTAAVFLGPIAVNSVLLVAGPIGDALTDMYPDLGPVARMHGSPRHGTPTIDVYRAAALLGFDTRGRPTAYAQLTECAARLRTPADELERLQSKALSTDDPLVTITEWWARQARRWLAQADVAEDLLRHDELPGSPAPK